MLPSRGQRIVSGELRCVRGRVLSVEGNQRTESPNRPGGGARAGSQITNSAIFSHKPLTLAKVRLLLAKCGPLSARSGLVGSRRRLEEARRDDMTDAYELTGTQLQLDPDPL